MFGMNQHCFVVALDMLRRRVYIVDNLRIGSSVNLGKAMGKSGCTVLQSAASPRYKDDNLLCSWHAVRMAAEFLKYDPISWDIPPWANIPSIHETSCNGEAYV